MEIDADVSVSSTKTISWSGLLISLHGRKQVKKSGSELRETIMMDSDTAINLFGNPNRITNIKKADMPMDFLTNVGLKNGILIRRIS